jgi:voltage-gated potassium channel
MVHERFRRFFFLSLSMAVLFAIGVVYFYTTKGSLSEAIWLTISVVSTMGMADISKFTPEDKILASVLVIAGVIIFSFLIANLSELVLSGHLQSYFGEKKMKERLDKMKDHYIICGFGRIGKAIACSLVNEKLPVVIIEKDKELSADIPLSDSVVFLEGDTTQDDVLKEAGIEKAIGLFSALGDDPENLLTVLTARALNPKIKIVTRVSSQELEIRFLRAGADSCISPQSWGSRSMVLTMIHPTLSQMLQQFLDKTIEAGTFIEISIPDDSSISGKTLEGSGIRKTSLVNVIGIRKAKNRDMLVNPQADTIVESGDTLICLGDYQSFKKLKEYVGYK